ncbi:hypothetical protein ANCCAN_08019 [Ancylostoma caninum]|uniref:AB hydrolase-1 domain-containing protein n=1 Tax=Ancylostoma caninum TaxID=29170 RepID=A0A368GNP6_ANCCA|nr:hypothetical protein ANCCAN_08019 [Ancylostoma caninum]
MLSLHRSRFCQLSGLYLRKLIKRRSFSTKRIYDAKAGLYSVPVRFRNNKGDLITLDAVYQDTMPEGGQRATVFAVHGAPGTHADFKYLVPQLKNNNVRMIMPNFPGLGFTPSDPRLCCENEERNEFAQAVLDSVDNLGTTALIFMGHSRGGENALQIATSELNVVGRSSSAIFPTDGRSLKEKVRGIVMLNAAGLRIHRGIQPYWKIDYFIRLLDLEVFNFILEPFLYFVYNRIMGLKVPTGAAAAMALRAMRTFGYEKILPSVETVNSRPEIKLLHAFSGQDYFIQADVSRELAMKFENRVDLECSTYDSKDVTRATIEAFSGGAQTVSVNFVDEGHFLQKFRAQYLIDVILALVSELSPTIRPDVDLSTN